MPAVILVVAIGALALGAAALLPKLIAETAKNRKLAECGELEQRLARERVQGGNPVLARQIELDLRACLDSAKAQGADIDPTVATLTGCDLNAAQIGAEWANYLATSTEDAVGRNNRRQAILRLGSEMVECYRRAVNEATTARALDRIEKSVNEQILQSKMRIDCFLGGAGPCSRYGVNEPHSNDRAGDELTRIGIPLGIVDVHGVKWDNVNGNYANGGWASPEHAWESMRAADNILRLIARRRAEISENDTANSSLALNAGLLSNPARFGFKL